MRFSQYAVYPRKLKTHKPRTKCTTTVSFLYPIEQLLGITITGGPRIAWKFIQKSVVYETALFESLLMREHYSEESH